MAKTWIENINEALDGGSAAATEGESFSPEAMEKIESLVPQVNDVVVQESLAEVEDQKTRAFAQGLTFGFADEMEAFVRSLANKDVSYEQQRDQIRNAMTEYAKAKPGEALAMEVAGAVVPTIVSLFGGPAGWAKALQTVTTLGTKLAGRQGIGKTAHMTGKGTALYSVGAGEEGLVEDLKNAPGGYVSGLTLGALLSGGGQLAAEGVGRLLNTEIGKNFTPVVREQMELLMQKSGMTANQIIERVQNGVLMIENDTLRAAIKALSSMSNDASAVITKSTKARPLETKKDLLDEMQQITTGTKADKNVIKLYNATDDELIEAEQKAYKSLFKDTNPELPPQMALNLEDTMRTFPDMWDDMNKIYSTSKGEGLVPFFEVTDGVLRIIKKPTLQDAEQIFRTLRDIPRMNVNKGILRNVDAAAKTLKAEINQFSPELALVRQTASNTRTGRDAYEYGTKILSQNPEKIAVELEKFKQTPGAFDALRQGFMTTYKFRSGSSNAAIKNVAEEGKNFNEIVRMLFPMGNQADDIITKAQIAGGAIDTKNSVLGGTTTAREQVAADQMSIATQAARLKENPMDVGAGISLVRNLIKTRSPEMNPKDAQRLAELVTSKNADEVKDAMVDDGQIAKLLKVIDMAIYGASRLSSAGSKPVGAQFQEDRLSSSGLMDYSLGAVSDSIGNLMQQN